jgi:hypothetical protein
MAGVRVTHRPADEDVEEEVRVAPGLVVDRLGRLVEVPRDACLRLDRWWETTEQADGGDTLTRATYEE